MLPLSIALVAKSLDGNVGTQTQEQENKDRRTYVKKCDKPDRSSNCSGDPHIPRNRPKHAMLVEGPMETVSKAALCALVLAAAVKVIADLVRRMRATSRGERLARQ